jgi:hypothetical protein
MSLQEVRAVFCCHFEGPLGDRVGKLLDEAGVSKRRRRRARPAVLEQWLASLKVGGCWILRLSPGDSFWRHVRQARLPHRLLAFLGTHAAHYVQLSLSWWLVGRGTLQGRLEENWLVAWILI